MFVFVCSVVLRVVVVLIMNGICSISFLVAGVCGVCCIVWCGNIGRASARSGGVGSGRWKFN